MDRHTCRYFGELKPGAFMKAHFTMFLEFAGNRILVQRNYDCPEPS